LEIRKQMTDTTQQSAGGGIVQSYIHTTEIVERPAADRPLRDTIDAIADWLLGPALQLASAAQAVDEFAWRILAAGFPLARLTVHSGTLHPQFLGTSLIWWRETGQTVQTFIEHEVLNVVPYHDNPVLRAPITLRFRLPARMAVATQSPTQRIMSTASPLDKWPSWRASLNGCLLSATPSCSAH
jgi:hypothetical protein